MEKEMDNEIEAAGVLEYAEIRGSGLGFRGLELRSLSDEVPVSGRLGLKPKP